MRFPGLNEAELKCEIERMQKTIDPCSSETLYINWLNNELFLRKLEGHVHDLVGSIINEAVPAGVS